MYLRQRTLHILYTENGWKFLLLLTVFKFVIGQHAKVFNFFYLPTIFPFLISCLPFPVFKYLAEPSCSALFHGPISFFLTLYRKGIEITEES
jgi:hypothetical protein